MVQITIELHKWQNVYYYSKYVHNVKSCITYNYCKSDYFNCDMGVRQKIYALFYLLCS